MPNTIKTKTQTTMSRRDFLVYGSTSLIAIGAFTNSRTVSALEPVKLDDPVALAMKYTHESTVADQYCANCMHVSGDTTKEWLPCAIFPGKSVKAKGWCAAWQKAT